MASKFIPLYPDSYAEAQRCGETGLWEQSFRENVACSRDLERAAQVGTEEGLTAVLEKYGHKRTAYVLANTAKLMDEPLNEASAAWARKTFIPPDRENTRHFFVDIHAPRLEVLIDQTQKAYQALGLFGREHCSAGMYDENVKGKVLVLSTETLTENAWSQENQLWLATGGFGCDPKASGRAIYATNLVDGEQTRWSREDFCGVLDEQYLPEWAQEKLEALRAPKQEQAAAPTMGGMEMG